LLAPEEIKRIAHEFEQRSAESVLAWAVELFRPRLVLSCSFGGPTSMVILDMLMQIDRTVPVAYLDTGLLFEETLAFVATIAQRYGITPIAVIPKQSVQEQHAKHGDALWAHDPQHCCALRKIEPQREFLRAYDAWVTGIRRDQASTREQTPVIQWDKRFDLVKINPLATWDERSAWRYIAEHSVPYNPLLARGYASIGCTPCTRPVQADEDARAGRWSGFAKTECGLHISQDDTPT
jgi:phosphoadenosine phosphosulfate reductase